MAEGTKLRDDFERWAELSARMLVCEPEERARLVKNEGVEHEWNAADAHWYSMLLEDIDAGRMARLARYRAVCDRRRSEAPELDDKAVTLPGDEGATQSAKPHLSEPPLPEAWQEVPSFARDLAPSGIDPVAPAPEQTMTSLDLSALRSEAAALTALSSSLEQYTWLCAELEYYENHQDEVWAARHILTDAGRQNVHRAWRDRLAHDAAERERHEQLLEQYRRALDVAGQ